MLDRERRDHVDALRRAHETRADAAKTERKVWEQAVADAVTNGAPPPDHAGYRDRSGTVRRAATLRVERCTIERLAVLLQAQPRGMLLIADELAGWLANLGALQQRIRPRILARELERPSATSSSAWAVRLSRSIIC